MFELSMAYKRKEALRRISDQADVIMNHVALILTRPRDQNVPHWITEVRTGVIQIWSKTLLKEGQIKRKKLEEILFDTGWENTRDLQARNHFSVKHYPPGNPPERIVSQAEAKHLYSKLIDAIYNGDVGLHDIEQIFNEVLPTL